MHIILIYGPGDPRSVVETAVFHRATNFNCVDKLGQSAKPPPKLAQDYGDYGKGTADMLKDARKRLIKYFTPGCAFHCYQSWKR